MFRGKAIDVDPDFTTVETPQGTLRARTPKTEKTRLARGDEAFVFIRPESIKFASSGEFENRVKADITQSEFEGNFWQVYFNLPESNDAIKLSMVNDGREITDKVGSRVELGFNPELAVVLPQGALASE